MKKMFLPVLTSVLLLVGFITMVSMAPPPPDNTSCQEYYKEFVQSGGMPGVTKGQFLSGCNACLNPAISGGDFGVCMCKTIILIHGGIGGAPFGQCVNYFKNAPTP